MATQTAQYDHSGSKYDEYARTATLKRAECYTLFRLVGALEGKRVLDLASGLGFYTRQLKQRGAAQVECRDARGGPGTDGHVAPRRNVAGRRCRGVTLCGGDV
jgi:2-polyprenyl-3-methyl-5-hydroxy-6-metoxy-1,4-benzoquinol methylase